jgi:UDP-glucose 4-epimerase
MKVLVTGAAGFVGSVVTEKLVESRHGVVGLDNLKYGFRAAVHPNARLVEGDILDQALLEKLLREERIEAVAHLAAEAAIEDSHRDPGLFYNTNVSGGLSLLEAMVRTGVGRLVFSSTAAVYGQPATVPIPEDAPAAPCNAYGESKLAFERMLAWYRAAHGLKHITLRYFNACGATQRCGESRKRETHLIPIAIAAALGQRDGLQLFGTDYDTPDGTCIRDYIHVADIAAAHVLALEAIDRVGARTYNMGNSEGYSNRQVIAAVEEVAGQSIRVVETGRRPGDPARLVAQSQRIRQELGWHPAFPDLRTMVRTAWEWRQCNAGGYQG